jgi:group I intron endonuclease
MIDNLKKNTGIYSIVHKKSGKLYVGSTYCNFYDRFCSHRSTLNRNCHSSILLQRAWNKYGADAFEFKVLELGSSELHERELYYINLYKTYSPKFGYNISKETNNARLGHQQSTKTKRKISNKLSGIKRSKETIDKLSMSKLGALNPMYGKKQSKEYIEKRIKNNRKKIIRDDGKVYNSLQEAARDMQVNYQSISASLRKGYKTKGYRFSYV